MRWLSVGRVAAAVVVVTLSTMGGSGLVSAQGGDREELLARCESNATTPEDLRLCRDVVERILAPQDGATPASAPTLRPEGVPLVISGRGAQATEAFELAEGDYAIAMETSGAGDFGIGCTTSASLQSASGGLGGTASIEARTAGDDVGRAATIGYAIDSGRYYWQASFACDTWTITMQPVTLDPGTAITAPTTRSGTDSMNTEPLRLAAGDYLVTWTIDPPSGSSCQLYATLTPTDGSYGTQLVQAESDGASPGSGETRFFGLERGDYYWSVLAINFSFDGKTCGWDLIIKPQ